MIFNAQDVKIKFRTGFGRRAVENSANFKDNNHGLLDFMHLISCVNCPGFDIAGKFGSANVLMRNFRQERQVKNGFD